MKQDQRVMRLALPVALIREMDEVILKGLGGYSTRAEFIVDAIRERVLELSVEATEDAGAPPRRMSERGSSFDVEVHDHQSPHPSIDTQPSIRNEAPFALTALAPPESATTIEATSDLSRPEGQAMFGLHNRDYPSFWVLQQLATMTSTGPSPAERFYSEVLRKAWEFGEVLSAVERASGAKATALFPTNPEKRKPAETGFRSFAIGDYRPDDRGGYTTNGPLFEWRLAGLTDGDPGKPLIGLTALGWEVLQKASGLSVEEPHPTDVATAFLDHLAEHAPADYRGFQESLRAIHTTVATRQGVLEHVAKAWPQWTTNEVSTNTAGYIARAREWGLVEPKQIKGRYHLTPLGRRRAEGGNE